MAGSSLSDILTAIQNGVVALNNLGTQVKGSFTNIANQLASITGPGIVTSIATRAGAFTLNATSGITNTLNDIILSQATSAQFGAVKPDNTTITAAAGVISTTIATQANQESASSLVAAVTPGRQQFHPSAAKAWIRVTQAAGVYTTTASYNIASINKTATGVVVVNLTTAFSSADFAVIGTSTGVTFVSLAIGSSSQVTVNILRSSTEASTDSNFSLAFFGDQP